MSKSNNNLDQYIIQLIEDLRYSAQNLPDPNEVAEFDEESLPEELKMFADVERYLHGKAKKLAIVTGIETEKFPPVERLNDAHLSLLVNEMTRLLGAYGFYSGFPDKLPDEWKYRALRKKWDKEVVYAGGDGIVHFDFCSYEPDNCPFPQQYCGCKDFEDPDYLDDSDFSNDDRYGAEPF
jgi:hypothetical protein